MTDTRPIDAPAQSRLDFRFLLSSAVWLEGYNASVRPGHSDAPSTPPSRTYHVRPYSRLSRRPDPEPQRGFPEGSAAEQDQPVDRHLLRRRRPHPGARLGAPGRGEVVARNAPKPYLPIEGAANFREAVQTLLFGAGHEALAAGRVATIQSVGSSGGLKVGADFIARWLPGSEVWVSDPSWDNHRSMFEGAGLDGAHLSVLRRGHRRAGASTRCARAAPPARAQRRAAARLLPQPDRRRPDARRSGTR